MFWHLASSSRDTRLSATADLVGAVTSFQAAHSATPKESDDDEDEDEDDSDAESGIEVDGSEDGEQIVSAEDAELDAQFARDNHPDVAYTVKRLVRGLSSSRESSRLGFAVALTEVSTAKRRVELTIKILARIPSVSAAQVMSGVLRSSQWTGGMKGREERDHMFARLFGIVALADSGALFAPTSRIEEFTTALESLLLLVEAKAWLAEAAGWALVRCTEGLIASSVSWKDDAVALITEKVYADKSWTPEKVAITLVLQRAYPKLDWKTFTAPTFKHFPLLAPLNLVTLGRVLKEGGDDDAKTGTYKPQLHFVWDAILACYFPTPIPGAAPFADLFRVVVDEALFANTSSAERKYWGFQVFERALPLLDAEAVPLIFTPNFMRSWMNNLSSPDRHLHKAAVQTARVVQDHVKANPTAGFTLLSQLVGKHGRPDFDKVTKTKTVESIMANLTTDGVAQYVAYLEGIIVNGEGDAAALEDRRAWAMDQLLALCRNGAVPKTDAWVARVLDFLLVNGFFLIRKADKKNSINALQAIPKPPLSDSNAATARTRFFSALVEITSATPAKGDDRVQGADASGKLWLTRALETFATLEKNKNVELVTDADEEIKKIRSNALEVLAKVKKDTSDAARGTVILVSFLVLQTYDDVEDALDMLDEAVTAARGMFVKKQADAEAEPIAELLDVLIALLDKGSADLRTLANLVFGMVAPAMTKSSVEHLIAQLESSAAAEAADEEDEDSEDEEEDEEEEDDEDDEDDDDEDIDESDDDNAEVDPEFRRRVAEALKVSGALDDEEDEDSDNESVWDDDQMMKVDEQLAAVFKSQAAGKSDTKSDLKHAAIESLHFKNRVLDFFDAYARKQSTSPLILSLLVPLLRLSRAGGELANKAAGVLRTRIAKGTAPPPSSVNAEEAASILAEIHDLAQHAASAEFSTLCSSASLFVARAAPTQAQEAYARTLEDFMTRKASSVHPAFVLDYARRNAAKAWSLAPSLVELCAPGKSANAFRQTQGYTVLQALIGHLPALVKSGDVTQAEAEKVLKGAMGGVYDTFEVAAAGEGGYKADRLKEVAKFALAVARAGKALGVDVEGGRLEGVSEKMREGKTKEMKGVLGLLQQLGAVLGKEGKKEKSKAKGKMGKKEEEEKMDVDGEVEAEEEEKTTPKKRKAEGKEGKTVKKVKTKSKKTAA